MLLNRVRDGRRVICAMCAMCVMCAMCGRFGFLVCHVTCAIAVCSVMCCVCVMRVLILRIVCVPLLPFWFLVLTCGVSVVCARIVSLCVLGVPLVLFVL